MSPSASHPKAAVLQYTARGSREKTLPIAEALITAAAEAGQK